ncbi:MAG: insulinase family protein [bacterium]|nr:insulinase family protein [bacterium]
MKKHCNYTISIILLFFSTFFLEAAGLKIRTIQLDNGLRVILSPMENMDVACVTLFHIAGVRDDPEELKGISFLFRNLMGLGITENLGAKDHLYLVKQVGGTSSMSIGYDFSVFNQVLGSSAIDMALWRESERISSLRLDARILKRAKKQVHSRYLHLNKFDVHFRARRWVKEKIFAGTVYQTPLYGKLENIPTLRDRNIIRAYDNFRNLSSIIVVVSGNFDYRQVMQALNKRLGKLSFKKAPPKRHYGFIKPRTEYLYQNKEEENPVDPFMVYGIRAPSKHSLDRLYFDFIFYYLADKRISQLQRLMHKQNLEVTVNYEYTDFIEANGLIIELAAARRIDLQRAKFYMNKELATLKGKGKFISASEIKMVKTLMEIDFKKSLRDPEKRNRMLAVNHHLKGDWTFVEKYLQRLRNLSSWDVIRVAKKYLNKTNLVVLNVYGK